MFDLNHTTTNTDQSIHSVLTYFDRNNHSKKGVEDIPKHGFCTINKNLYATEGHLEMYQETKGNWCQKLTKDRLHIAEGNRGCIKKPSIIGVNF